MTKQTKQQAEPIKAPPAPNEGGSYILADGKWVKLTSNKDKTNASD